MNRRILPRLVFAWLATVSGISAAEESAATWTPMDAIAATAKTNPELAAALADLRGARALVEGERHRYTFVWGVEGGFARTEVPQLDLAGTTVPRTDELRVSTDLRRRFAHGGDAGLTVSGRRFTSQAYLGAPPERFELGPAYAGSVKLDVNQPLLRGAGTDVGEAGLHQARAQAEQTLATYHRVTSDSLAAVLGAYWELAYASQALAIQRESLVLAKQQRDEAKARVETGGLAASELSSFETRVAELESDVGDAEIEVERRRLEVERISGFDARDARLTPPPDQPVAALAPYAQLSAAARARAPALRELKAALRLAELQARIAGDSLRPALNVSASAEAQGLEEDRVSPVFRQIGKLSAFSAQIGLRYETSLDSTQRRMQIAEARYAVVAAQKRLESAARQLDAGLSRSYSEGRAAPRRVELARETVRLAERQHQAERELFETGTSTAIRVREAEEQVRASRLRLLRTQVDALETEIELDRLSGRLGEAYLTEAR